MAARRNKSWKKAVITATLTAVPFTIYCSNASAFFPPVITVPPPVVVVPPPVVPPIVVPPVVPPVGAAGSRAAALPAAHREPAAGLDARARHARHRPHRPGRRRRLPRRSGEEEGRG